MDVQKAPDVQAKVEEIISTLEPGHLNQYRIICMRSRNAKASAYARIWSFPDIWQKALEISTFYVIEVLSQHFDKLDEQKKEQVLIHELLHIPKTFSGALLAHGHPTAPVNQKRTMALWKEYVKRREMIRNNPSFD